MKWYQLISPISPPSISCSTGQVLFISHFIKHSCPNTACARLGDVALTASLFSKVCPSSSPDALLLLCSASSKARAEAINNFCLGVCVSHFMLCGFFFFFFNFHVRLLHWGWHTVWTGTVLFSIPDPQCLI